MNLDDLRNLPTPPPTGFEPGIHWDGDSGHVTVATAGEEPDRTTIDGVLDTSPFLSSDEICVDWSARPRVSIHHDDAGNVIQAWYRLPLAKKISRSFEIQEIVDRIHTDTPAPDVHGEAWRTIQVGDTHLGKSAIDGAGSEMLIDRWRSSVTAALELGGYRNAHIAFMGDLIEGDVSQNGKNIANNDMTLTESLRVARHMVAWTIQEALKYADEIVISSVPGNHSETTRVQNRPLTDSHDIDIVSSVQQAFELAGNDERIAWYYPEEGKGHIVYQVGDTVFASAHGHTFKGMVKGAENWWAGMSASGAPAAAAHILMAGHYHSPTVSNYTRNKWIMFGAALEDKSTWLNEANGASSRPGMMTYLTVQGEPFEVSVV